MRPLTDDEMKLLIEKLTEYIGDNVAKLLDRPSEPYVFRLVGDRVYYVSERHMRLSTNIARDNLVAMGTCLGKFSRGGKFRLHVTCLNILCEYAKFKVWLKPSAEMNFLYGKNVAKNGLARMTDAIPQYAGVIVMSMSDIPLGFGRAAQATEYCRDLDPTANVVLHQADIGEYLRTEDEMF